MINDNCERLQCIPSNNTRTHFGAFLSAILCRFISSSIASDRFCASACARSRASVSSGNSFSGGAIALVKGSSLSGSVVERRRRNIEMNE